jgi:hypothetical protein
MSSPRDFLSILSASKFVRNLFQQVEWLGNSPRSKKMEKPLPGAAGAKFLPPPAAGPQLSSPSTCTRAF